MPTTDYFKKVATGTVTTLAAPGKGLGATSINVGSTANMPTDTGIIIAIRTVDTSGNLVAGTYTEWSATVASATSLSIVAVPVYGNDQAYTAGSTTQVFIPASSYAYNKLIDGLLVSHNQDGTQKVPTSYQGDDGWTGPESGFTYASATTANVTAGALTKYSVGDKLKLSQSVPLTAYWPMDSSSTDTKGGYNGTDTAVTYTAGKFGNAATFVASSSSAIAITDNAALKPGSAVAGAPFTFAGWIKTGTTGTTKGIFQTYSANTSIAGLQVYVSTSNVVTLTVGNNTGTTVGTNYTSVVGTANVCDNAWHYVVVSYQSNFIKVWVDGVLDASGYCIAPAYAATNYVRIGCLNSTGANGSYWNGQIDDLFLINGFAVDQAWVAAKYAAASAQSASNVTATQYFYVTAVADTLLTLTGGSDYALYNGAITSPYYSKAATPVGFPASLNAVGGGVAGKIRYAGGQLVQSGSSTTLSGGDTTLTFPVAFSSVPCVTASPSTTAGSQFVGACEVFSKTTTNFQCNIPNLAGNRVAMGFDWTAWI